MNYRYFLILLALGSNVACDHLKSPKKAAKQEQNDQKANEESQGKVQRKSGELLFQNNHFDFPEFVVKNLQKINDTTWDSSFDLAIHQDGLVKNSRIHTGIVFEPCNHEEQKAKFLAEIVPNNQDHLPIERQINFVKYESKNSTKIAGGKVFIRKASHAVGGTDAYRVDVLMTFMADRESCMHFDFSLSPETITEQAPEQSLNKDLVQDSQDSDEIKELDDSLENL